MMKSKEKRNVYDRCYEVLSFFRFTFVCFVCISLLLTVVVRHEVVLGSSMFPTLKDGEHVLVNVASTYVREIERFDIVIVKSHNKKDLWVKRVIGLPGEVVEYRNDKLYINNHHVKETFFDTGYIRSTKDHRKALNFTNNYISKRLGKGEYIVMGDNRMDSHDSRSPDVGPFKRDQIIANGVFVITPLKEMRYIQNGR